jgi:hypothetical protein
LPATTRTTPLAVQEADEINETDERGLLTPSRIRAT